MASEIFIRIFARVAIGVFALVYPILIACAIINWILSFGPQKKKNIAGEIALITGGAKGLGKDIAIELAKQGCHIAIADIDQIEGENTAQHITQTYNVKAMAFKTDVRKFHEVVLLSSSVEDHLGPVTILVNNAGVMLFSTSDNPPPLEVQNMIDTNLTANIWTVRVFLENMRKLRKGHIVGIGSLSGVIACPRQLVYTATKYGLRGFMNTLAPEMYALNCEFIKTTHVVPFILDTNAKAVNLARKSNFSRYPIIKGSDAAEAIVEAILTNQMQVYLPGELGLFYRLLEMLPRKWQLYAFNKIVGKETMILAEY